MSSDVTRLKEARKQVGIVLERRVVGPLVAADLDAALMNLDGCIDAIEAQEADA